MDVQFKVITASAPGGFSTYLVGEGKNRWSGAAGGGAGRREGILGLPEESERSEKRIWDHRQT